MNFANLSRPSVSAFFAAAFLAAPVVAQTPPITDAAPATRSGTAAEAVKSGDVPAATTVPEKPSDASVPVAAARSPVPVVVLAVEGSVRVRFTDDPGAKFKLLKGGERLSESAEFSIGAKSAIQIRVADHQVFTFDQLGKVTLRRALKDGETNVTRLSMTSGRVSFDVDSTKSRNDVKIETSEMTLAIKGTSGAVEVRPGFGTRAFGDLENTGRIEVDWKSGVRAVMTRSEATDSQTPNPAHNQNELVSVDTPKVESRDKDEKRLLKRTGSTKQDVQFSVGKTKGPGVDSMLLPSLEPPAPPPPPTVLPSIGGILHIDATRGDLYETAAGSLNTGIIRTGFPIDPTASIGGAAVLHDSAFASLPALSSSSLGKLIYLETSTPSVGSVRNRLSELDLSRPGDPPRVVGQFTGDASLVPTLHGLGSLGPSLYATGSVAGQSGLYRLDLARGELTQAMDLRTTFDGALGGATSRGTLFAVVRDPGAVAGASVLSRSAIVEIDPRTNFLAAAYTGLNGSLSETSSTSNSSDVNLDSLEAITGLAAVNGGVILTGVSGASGGRAVLLRYDTAGNLARLADVRNLPDRLTHGLANETPGPVGASAALTNPPGRIDRVTISAAFANLGYSQHAFNSGLVERLVKREVVAGASMPESCAASSEIGTLRAYLQAHVGQRAGVGRAVADFHDALPANHPCD